MPKYTTVRVDRKIVGAIKAYAHERGITITEAATQLARMGLTTRVPEPDADVPPVLRNAPTLPAPEPQTARPSEPPAPLDQLVAAVELLTETVQGMRAQARPPSGFRRKAEG